ncbi:MAG TPA: tRNA (adenosine(37)-N6)-threonylcarbamoyltransferase complex ATPase subunit type 1 TsaE [Nitrospiraceae bacterium]|nr:tRNA (adenosine(37)-N6)-threonylcarbamoyltransferase complex ATPase subunit type 1 TsaE [Nitrospiraceae bacterium]
MRYGVTLGCLLKKGDTVCLYGDLGSGKTTFVKGIASALGVPERDVTSASFTIVAEHIGTLQGSSLPFYHIDLYRIERPIELDSIGLEGYLGREGISVIEWAERLQNAADSISVTFTVMNEDEREITIKGIHEEDWNNL